MSHPIEIHNVSTIKRRLRYVRTKEKTFASGVFKVYADYLSFQKFCLSSIEMPIVHKERRTDGDDARGIDEVICNPPTTPPPVKEAYKRKSIFSRRPHR